MKRVFEVTGIGKQLDEIMHLANYKNTKRNIILFIVSGKIIVCHLLILADFVGPKGEQEN